ncbi:MAG: DUF2442 domain-containing protein [Candidatus Latescibacterota bacterium]
MSYDATKVTCLGGYILEVEFEDGEKGKVNLGTLAERGGVFSSFSDPDYFRQVSIDRELGVLSWPGGVDIAPEAVYHLATGKPISS